MNPKLLRKDVDSIFKEVNLMKKLDTFPRRALSTWYMILNKTTNEIIYRSTNEGRRNSVWFKKYFQKPEFVRTEYETHEQDLLKSKQIRQWNNGFTHQPLNYIQAGIEESRQRIYWPWEETLVERQESITKEKERYRNRELSHFIL